MTLPERRQRVHTRMRRVAPLMSAFTDWRFGSKRLGPTLCAWEMVRPTTGPFPQISHRFAMIASGNRTEAPDCDRRKPQIVVDGQGMINDDRVVSCKGCAPVRLRCSRRAINVRYDASPGSIFRVSRAPFSMARSTIATSRS